MNRKMIKKLTISAMIAAVYFVITIIFSAISFQAIQIRVSEAFTVLPYFTPLAVPALFVGCLLSNILGGNGIWDIVVGSLATLLAAYLTYKISYKKPSRKLLAPLPSVIVNAVAIGVMLSILYETPLYFNILTVGVGQLIACYLLGYPLMLLIEKNKKLRELFNDET